jgi:hypothetical protein
MALAFVNLALGGVALASEGRAARRAAAAALVTGHWSAWQAAHVEVNQTREAAQRAEQDVAEDAVQKLIANPLVCRSSPR